MKSLALGILAAALSAAPSPAHEAHSGAEGVIGLDLYASGDVVDALTAVQPGGRAAVELRHVRSTDGGRTWSPPRPILPGRARVFPPRRGAEPQIAASGDRIVVIWTEPGSSPWGSGPLASAISGDGGRSWKAAGNPADDGTTKDHGFVDVAALAPGRFLAVWLDGRGGTQGLRSAASPDGGVTWGRNVTVDPRTCECCANRLLVRGGAAHVIYRARSPRDMAVATTSDGGATWTRRGTPGRFGWDFDGCPEVGGALAATTDGAGGRERLVALGWTGKDDVAGVWAQTSDGSGAWSAPRRLGDATARQLDLAANGPCTTAVWDEYRAGTKRHLVMAATSCDGGRRWSPPAAISDPAVSASYPLAVATSEGALAAWTERAGNGALAWKARPLAKPRLGS